MRVLSGEKAWSPKAACQHLGITGDFVLLGPLSLCFKKVYIPLKTTILLFDLGTTSFCPQCTLLGNWCTVAVWEDVLTR